MLTIEKISELLDIAKYEYPSLYNELIEVDEDNRFSVTNIRGIGMFYICYASKLPYDDHKKWMYKYLEKEYGLDGNKLMYNDFIEVFAFLHEVGHIYYTDITSEDEEYYQEYKAKVYNSYNEAWYQYRQIPSERMADEFAVNIIKKNIYKIWSIMNDISIEKAKEEYEFWNE